MRFDDVLASTSGYNIDSTDAMGRNLLSWAAARGDSAIVEKLLLRGANPGLRDAIDSFTSLHWGCFSGNFQCIRTLVAAKADVHARDRWRRTALQSAVGYGGQPELIQILLGAGANIESCDFEGFNTLHEAALMNNPNVAVYLIEMGANINAITESGYTATAFAIQGNSHETLEALLSYTSSYTMRRTVSGMGILVTAAHFADYATLRILKSGQFGEVGVNDTSKGWTAFELARCRRDFNEMWSLKVLRPPDLNPIKWYAAFEDLLDSITTSQQNDECRFSNQFCEEEATSCGETSDGDNADEVEEQEKWEDAQETPNQAIE